MTPGSEVAREGIRSGRIECPQGGLWCNKQMAQHHPDCAWQKAVEYIYRVEREEESQHGFRAS